MMKLLNWRPKPEKPKRTRAVVLSLASVALVSLLGWMRHTTQAPTDSSAADPTPEEEHTLFIG